MAVDSFERVSRLDPLRAVDVIADATGVRLVLDGRPRGGEVGAAYVPWSDEHRSVLPIGSARVASLLDLARPRVLDELVPAAWHHVQRYANN